MERTDEEYLEWKRKTDFIQNRWKQLYELEKEWGKEAIKYLMLLNSGAAVATLSFIGASNAARESIFPALALTCFFLGVIAAGILVAKAHHDCSRLFRFWQNDVERHFADPENLSYEDLLRRDDERVPAGGWDEFWGYSSFGCFIVGVIRRKNAFATSGVVASDYAQNAFSLLWSVVNQTTLAWGDRSAHSGSGILR